MTDAAPPVSTEGSDRLGTARARFRVVSLWALGITVAAIAVTVMLGLQTVDNTGMLTVPLALMAFAHWRIGHATRAVDVRAGRVLGWLGALLAAALLFVVASLVKNPWVALVACPVLVAMLAVHVAVIATSWVVIARDPADSGPGIGWKAWLVIVAASGLILVIATPRGHSPLPRNESVAIGDLRAFASAQYSYQSANEGYFGEPACLVRPAQCIPGYPANAPTFLDASGLIEVRSGYRRTFHPGQGAQPTPQQAGRVAPGSLTGWVYTAVPERYGKTGIRSFCLDSAGVIGYSNDEARLKVRDARCPEGLKILQ